MPARFLLFILAVAQIGLSSGDSTHALDFELSPNPNPKQNTINIPSGDTGINSAELFENFGAIVVQSGGTLRNVTEMDILCDENNGNCGLKSVSVEAGGTLDVLSNSKMNFDSLSNLSVSGTVDNAGDISADWSVQLAVGSQFNNSGIFTNKKGATLRGTFINTGSVVNFTPFNDTGGLFQQIGQYTNEVGSSLTNQGEFINFTTITNRGTITNTTNGGGGISRGIFRNFVLIDNEATGVITNRHRWFNTGALNNAGTFTNHLLSSGMANQTGGSIHNLPGGIFYNDRSLISSTTILNEGDFFVNDSVSGSGTYTQTAGMTAVSDSLTASNIDIQGGLLTGGGTLVGPVAIGATATVSPGNSPGTLTVNGSYAQQSGSVLSIEIGGLVSGSEFDVLSVVGGATLDGTLNVSLVDLGGGIFSPSSGNSFDILTTTARVSGVFSTHNLPALGGGLAWDVIYGANTVTLNVSSTVHTADFNSDGFVDGNDLAQWETSFGVDAGANADADSDSDGADFLAWQQQYTGTGILSNVSVPEPASLVCALVMLGGMEMCRWPTQLYARK